MSDDNKQLPQFHSPQPAKPHRMWVGPAGCSYYDLRLATVDDLRAVVLALPVDDLPEGWSVMLSPVASAQAQSFARSCVGTTERDELRWRARAEAAEALAEIHNESDTSWKQRALAAEHEIRDWRDSANRAREALAQIRSFAFSKCDSDEPEETAPAQVELLWQEQVDEIVELAEEVAKLRDANTQLENDLSWEHAASNAVAKYAAKLEDELRKMREVLQRLSESWES
jgi:hypothetical protein